MAGSGEVANALKTQEGQSLDRIKVYRNVSVYQVYTTLPVHSDQLIYEAVGSRSRETSNSNFVNSNPIDNLYLLVHSYYLSTPFL